jgi:hypothetical protein|tara:strand:- start:170 stop:577 length:408 start_codon:yes stop_codon:yes gene_type:complete
MTRYNRYNKEIEEKILDRLRQGESIRKITSDPDMVSWATFANKLKDNEKLVEKYYNSKKIGIEIIISAAHDKLLEAIKNLENGEKKGDLSYSHLIKEMQSNAKWLSSVLAPGRYSKSDKLSISGGDKPLTIKWEK